MTIQQDLQKAAVGKYVELFVLDITPLGGPIFRFTPNTVGGASSVSFGSQVYTALPISGEGWQTSMDGQAPQPTLTVSNVVRFLQPYVSTYGDLVGAKITRLQTLDKYLDTGSTPDSTQVFNSSVYIIEQKTKQNFTQLEFRLVSVIDAPEFKLPKGQVTRAIFPGAGLFRKS
jgi:lambda family phage minor tail protein L